jgi:hypothetical protein
MHRSPAKSAKSVPWGLEMDKVCCEHDNKIPCTLGFSPLLVLGSTHVVSTTIRSLVHWDSLHARLRINTVSEEHLNWRSLPKITKALTNWSRLHCRMYYVTKVEWRHPFVLFQREFKLSNAQHLMTVCCKNQAYLQASHNIGLRLLACV